MGGSGRGRLSNATVYDNRPPPACRCGTIFFIFLLALPFLGPSLWLPCVYEKALALPVVPWPCPSCPGVAPRTIQKAMRHSNLSLTMGTYTDPDLLDTADAVESLPDLPLTGQRHICCSPATPLAGHAVIRGK